MAKIIKFDPSRRQKEEAAPANSCDHKNVVACATSRTVQCAICGTELDTFDVLLELIKGYIPPGDQNHKQEKFDRESIRRLEKNRSK